METSLQEPVQSQRRLTHPEPPQLRSISTPRLLFLIPNNATPLQRSELHRALRKPQLRKYTVKTTGPAASVTRGAAGRTQAAPGGGGQGPGGLPAAARPRQPASIFLFVKESCIGFLFTVTVNALEGKDCKESVKLIAESTNLSEEQLAFLISGMYTLLREALRLPLSTFKQEVFKEDLKELRIPEDFIADFSSIVFGNRRPVSEGTAQRSRLPSVQDFKWRVDVAISTSSLARALQPSILMLLKLSDGTAHRFEVPVAKFQELRYNVALILKEMNDLEKRSILKIQD
uniref:COMM domain-containing protein 5 n=1 Tax=Dromaius novaehollandiae TaxID=8790 RepID=A0A8C4P895_DRONO